MLKIQIIKEKMLQSSIGENENSYVGKMLTSKVY